MARYFLVQYVKRADGNWQSPPECEDVWKRGCFKQVRFDGVSGVGEVVCTDPKGLPASVATQVDAAAIRTWLSKIPRLPKVGATPTDSTVTPYTLDEEDALLTSVRLAFAEGK